LISRSLPSKYEHIITKYFSKAKEHGVQWQFKKATVSLVLQDTVTLGT